MPSACPLLSGRPRGGAPTSDSVDDSGGDKHRQQLEGLLCFLRVSPSDLPRGLKSPPSISGINPLVLAPAVPYAEVLQVGTPAFNGNLLEMHILRAHPDLLNQNL